MRASAPTVDQPDLPLDVSPLAAIARVECQENLAFLRNLADDSVKLVVTLPPYNLGKDYERRPPVASYLEAQRAGDRRGTRTRDVFTGVPYYERESAERDPAGPWRSGRAARPDRGGAVSRSATRGAPVNIRDAEGARRRRPLTAQASSLMVSAPISHPVIQETISMPGWLGPVGIPAAIALLVGVGIWVGKVMERLGNIKETADADRETFQKAITEDRTRVRTILDEIRGDIKKMFHSLGQAEAVPQSPLRLTDYGRELLAGIGGEPWAARLATALKDGVQGMEAYEIQEFCFDYVENKLEPSDDEQAAMRRTAYEKGARMAQVQRVLALELRDRLLRMTGQEAPE